MVRARGKSRAWALVAGMILAAAMGTQAQAMRIAPEDMARMQQAQRQDGQRMAQQGAPQDGGVNQDILDLYQPYAAESQTEASKPHRSVEELAEWLSGVILEVLEIPSDHAAKSVEAAKPYFTQPAYREFLTFLSDQSYWLFISQRKYNMTAASVQLPQLLCKQDEAGFYTWIYEVPVIILLEESEDTPEPSGKTAREVVNLRIRLVRIPNMKETEKNPHEVLIENWRLQKEGDAVVLNDNERGCMIE